MSKRKKWLAVLLFTPWSLLVMAVLYRGPKSADMAPSEEQLYSDVRRQTFRLLNPDGMRGGGTGFAVTAPSGRKYTLTNAHVCEMTDRPFVIAEQEGSMRRLTIIAISTKTDLCILEAVPGYPGLTVAKEATLYSHAYVVGHPYLHPISIKGGYLNGSQDLMLSYCRRGEAQILEPEEIEAIPFSDYVEMERCIRTIAAVSTDAEAHPGNSGSPVVNAFGQIVGVLFAGNGRGLNFIVPRADVEHFLKQF